MAELTHRTCELLTSIAPASLLAQELSRIETAAVDTCSSAVSLDRFVILNYLGFIKIAKKHDKLTGRCARHLLQQRLATNSFLQHRFDAVVVSMSDVFATLRARRAGKASSAAVWVPPTDFERATVKYWVTPEDVLAVKLALVKHLPVLVFGRAEPSGRGVPAAEPPPASDSQLISSVYLDNERLDVYHERLERAEGAALIRLRWYGDGGGAGGQPLPEKEVFVERKTHHESWTVDTSVKERFRIKAKQVSALLMGELDVEAHLRKLRSSTGGTASERDVSRTQALAGDVLRSVLGGRLGPGELIKRRRHYGSTNPLTPALASIRTQRFAQHTTARRSRALRRMRCACRWIRSFEWWMSA